MSEPNLAKIAITSSSDVELSSALERVNQDFEGGRVTKVDLTSWLILRALSTFDASAIDDVRKAHFNQVVYLESMLKRLKSSGRDSLGPEDLAALQAMLAQQTTKKRTKTHKQPDAVTSQDKVSSLD